MMDYWNTDSIACQIHLANLYTELYPSDMYGWVVLADGLGGVSSFEKASRALQKARRLCPDNVRSFIYTRIGRFYREKGDHARAEKWYRKAVNEEQSQENLVFLGACLAKQGKYSEARTFHSEAVTFSPESADEAFFNLGLIHRAEENYVEALRFFQKAIQIDTDYDEAKTAEKDILKLFEIRRTVENKRLRPKRSLDT